MANGQEDPFADVRRKIEEILGYPAGAFNPASNFLRDMERINRALGEGFKTFQDVIGPEQLKDRIEALHLDQAVSRVPKALQDIMNLPRKMWDLKPPPTNGFNRRY